MRKIIKTLILMAVFGPVFFFLLTMCLGWFLAFPYPWNVVSAAGSLAIVGVFMFCPKESAEISYAIEAWRNR